MKQERLNVGRENWHGEEKPENGKILVQENGKEDKINKKTHPMSQQYKIVGKWEYQRFSLFFFENEKSWFIFLNLMKFLIKILNLQISSKKDDNQEK